MVVVTPIVILFTLVQRYPSEGSSGEQQKADSDATISPMDQVKVLFFGAAADQAGIRETEVTANGVSLNELWSMLTVKYPALSPMRGTLAFAINGEYARMDEVVSAGDEVAVLPPVSGG